VNLPERTGAQVRIGVAIAVPEPFSTQLRDARRLFGDPQAEAIPPHITVLGPTVLEPDELSGALVHLRAAATSRAPFRVVLRGTGSFRPVSPVVFAQVAQGIAECEALESAIRTGPLDFPLRFPYHPHVTVAHEVPDAALDRAFTELAGFEAEFDVREVHLFEHGDDGVWRPERGFRLGELSGGASGESSARLRP
jgi:2'-5' RNA ligase